MESAVLKGKDVVFPTFRTHCAPNTVVNLDYDMKVIVHIIKNCYLPLKLLL